MPRVRSKSKRSTEVVESKFRFCHITKKSVFKGICEEKCEDKNCPISRAKIDAQLKKKMKAAARRRKKKIEKEQKKLDNLGLTRNLLLKPEDRIDEAKGDD